MQTNARKALSDQLAEVGACEDFERVWVMMMVVVVVVLLLPATRDASSQRRRHLHCRTSVSMLIRVHSSLG